MKHYYLTFIGLIMINLAIGQSFQKQYGLESELHWKSISKVPNSDIVYLVGEEGAFKKSNDNGDSWVDLTVDNKNFTGIDIQSSTVGFLVATDGSFYQGTGADLDWTVTHTFSFEPTQVLFENDLIGYCIGRGGNIWRTSDAGLSWDSLSSEGTNDLYGIALQSSGEFTVVGASGTILSYTDFGNSVVSYASGTTNVLYDISFGTSTTGFIVGWKTSFRTIDGGTTWNAVDISATAGGSPSSTYKAVEFLDENNGFVVNANAGFSIYSTTDGGLTWERGVNNNSYPTEQIYSSDNGDLFIIGSDNLVLKSVDSGLSWLLSGDEYSMLSFRTVFALNDSIAYVAGSNGAMFKTVNGGENWKALRREISLEPINDIYFMNENEGFYGTGFGSIYKTNDCGETWTLEYENTATEFNDKTSVEKFYFLNDQVGFAYGWNNSILKTTDGGQTWTSKSTQNDNKYYKFTSMTFVSENEGFIYGPARQSGWGSRVYKTEDVGETWTLVKELSQVEFSSEMAFVNADTGYIALSKGVFAYTYDAGVTWTENRSNFSFFELMSEIQFIDEKVGFMNSRTGYYKTVNSGVTWVKVEGELTSNIFFITEQTGYSVSGGNIVKISDSFKKYGDFIETPTGITSRETCATYQWVNCCTGQDIVGATTETFSPIESGDYAVRVTQYGYSTLSECYSFGGSSDTVYTDRCEGSTFAFLDGSIVTDLKKDTIHTSVAEGANGCDKITVEVITMIELGTTACPINSEMVPLFTSSDRTRISIPKPTGSQFDLGTGDFSVEAIINASSATTASYPMVISTRTTHGNGFFLCLNPSGKLFAQLAGKNYSSSSISLTDDQCHHIGLVREGDDVKFYVDGLFVGYATQSGGNININDSNDTWYIGNDEHENLGSNVAFEGTIRELRVWNVARSDQELVSNVNASLSGSEPGLLAYYRLNDGQGQQVVDLSGGNNHGQLGNTLVSETVDPVWVLETCEDIVTGNEEEVLVTQASVELYPTKVDDFVSVVSSSNDNMTYKIYNVNYQLIQSGNVSNSSRINVSSLTSGLSFIELTLENGQVITKKLVK